MLRLPPYRYHRPSTVAEAVDLKAEHGAEAMYIAGGTDLVPNMKHRLFEPGHLIALKGIDEMRGVSVSNGDVRIGAGETLTALAMHSEVRARMPALADAAAHVAGPQLRNAATLGGNLCLDTRCTYYNQTAFWRGALGYCLKKDGDVCHVTKVGKKCVAAHSADTPPVLMALDAVVELSGPHGDRELAVRDFFLPDGIANTRRAPDEVLVAVRVPSAARRQGYAKLRQRRSIDFPLLTVAIAAEVAGDGAVRTITGVVTGLGARPRMLTGWNEIAAGRPLDDEVVDALAARALEQCHPLENMIVDAEWRRAMVPVYVRRALAQVRAE